MKNPCKDCEDRHHNCHAHCEEYQDFTAERDWINKRRFQYNQLTLDNESEKHKIQNYYRRFK